MNPLLVKCTLYDSTGERLFDWGYQSSCYKRPDGVEKFSSNITLGDLLDAFRSSEKLNNDYPSNLYARFCLHNSEIDPKKTPTIVGSGKKKRRLLTDDVVECYKNYRYLYECNCNDNRLATDFIPTGTRVLSLLMEITSPC